VFSHIYLGNQSPAKVAGFRLDLTQNELPVDNFFTEIFFNDFKAQLAKSCKSTVFIYFRQDHALFQCPAEQGVKKALQALIS
jgi:hypothetical protein